MSVVSPPAPLVASLSRRDLQALGKSLGVKVNGKVLSPYQVPSVGTEHDDA